MNRKLVIVSTILFLLAAAGCSECVPLDPSVMEACSKMCAPLKVAVVDSSMCVCLQEEKAK